MLDSLKKLLDSMGVFWAVCGGDAIDLFVGMQTRAHKDIDVAALWEDRERVILQFLSKGWRVFEPDHGLFREITNLEEDLRTEDNLWCIRPETKGYQIVREHDNFYKISTERKQQNVLDYVEVLFNRVVDGKFLYKRNPEISLERYLYHDAEGIPYLAPEMVLLYKSIFVRMPPTPENLEVAENYRHDFRVAEEKMSAQQRRWLKAALEICYLMGHEWVPLL